MDRYREVLQWYNDICFFQRGSGEVSLSIACLKAAMAELGVITSDAVAPGTPDFDAAERREFSRRFRAIRERAANLVEAGYASESISRPSV